MTTFVITVSQAEADLIGLALGRLPLEQTLSLWLSLKSQIGAQESASKAENVQPEKDLANGDDTSSNAAG